MSMDRTPMLPGPGEPAPAAELAEFAELTELAAVPASAAPFAPFARLVASFALALGLSLALALAWAAVASADVPDPRNSSADTTLVGSPGGSFSYTVYLRDSSNAPIVGGTVVLDFTTASGLVICSELDPDSDGRVLGTTNGIGAATFQLRIGGSTTGRVTVGSALDVIARAWPRTMDFDGDLDVDASDRSALQALMGTGGPAGDYDLNGIVNSADLAIFDGTMGQTCATTPARATTWGSVKALYR